MIIGIDASRAFVKNRTGIEEYSFQVIKSLMNKLEGHQVVLYVRPTNYESSTNIRITNGLDLPKNWRIRVIRWPFLWTQIGLSLELLFHPVDVLFVPAHTVPIVHPKNTIVTIHGLEYEFCPKAYSFWERLYMRCVIKNSVKWAKKIVAVSENTKKDLVKLYGVLEEKISVVYEGVSLNNQKPRNNNQTISNNQLSIIKPYLLFIGRLEERKNICGIVGAFEILKEKYKIPHKLVLAGKHGYNFERIMNYESRIKHWKDIEFRGFVGEEEKYELLKNAEVFLFPTFYEGFGLPILEAQAVGTPVVTSNISSMPEIAFPKVEPSEDCFLPLVDPNKPEEIAEAIWKLISDENLKNDMIKRGLENVKRFSWEKCGEEISQLLVC